MNSKIKNLTRGFFFTMSISALSILAVTQLNAHTDRSMLLERERPETVTRTIVREYDEGPMETRTDVIKTTTTLPTASTTLPLERRLEPAASTPPTQIKTEPLIARGGHGGGFHGGSFHGGGRGLHGGYQVGKWHGGGYHDRDWTGRHGWYGGYGRGNWYSGNWYPYGLGTYYYGSGNIPYYDTDVYYPYSDSYTYTYPTDSDTTYYTLPLSDSYSYSSY